MKAVVFVCLLSLSLCLSQPTSNQQPDAPPTLAASAKVDKEAAPKGTLEQSTHATVVSIKTLNESSPTEHNITKAPAPTEAAAANAKPATNKTEQKETEKAVDPKSNESKSGEPAKKNETKTETPKEEMKPANAPVPKPTEESKPATTSAPVKPVTEKAAETPKDTTETPMVGKRAFDGPSFIGGIILTLGLLAIGFMGFKYYKNQTERNYHTL